MTPKTMNEQNHSQVENKGVNIVGTPSGISSRNNIPLNREYPDSLKGFNKELAEIDKGCHKYTIGKPYFDEDGDKVQDNFSCNKYKLCPECQTRKSQLQTDMKIVEELKKEELDFLNKLEPEIFDLIDGVGTIPNIFLERKERLEKELFKESVGR